MIHDRITPHDDGDNQHADWCQCQECIGPLDDETPWRANPADHLPSFRHTVHDRNCDCQPEKELNAD